MMRFTVRLQGGDYGDSWVTEESSPEGTMPNTSQNCQEAFRFHLLADAKEMAVKTGYGYVEVLDEPSEFRNLDEAASAVSALRADMLFGSDGQFDHLPRYAQHHLMLAIQSLDIAYHHLKLGWMEALDKR